MIVIDPQTIQCAFDVAPLAATGPRHVTVKTGPLQDTLINAFTVTP